MAEKILIFARKWTIFNHGLSDKSSRSKALKAAYVAEVELRKNKVLSLLELFFFFLWT